MDRELDYEPLSIHCNHCGERVLNEEECRMCGEDPQGDTSNCDCDECDPLTVNQNFSIELIQDRRKTAFADDQTLTDFDWLLSHVKKLKEALNWYANPDNYNNERPGYVMADKAQEVLKEE